VKGKGGKGKEWGRRGREGRRGCLLLNLSLAIYALVYRMGAEA